MATRRFEEGFWNHGIAEIVQEDLPADFPEDWIPLLPSQKEPLTSLPKLLSESLSVLKNTKITKLSYEPSSHYWLAQSEDGNTYQGKVVVSTAPTPQTVELLEASRLRSLLDPQNTLSKLDYFKQLIFLAQVIQVGKAIPIFRRTNFFKETFVSFELSFSESEALFEEEDSFILDSIKNLLEENGWKFSHFEIKRWRYSQCKNSMKEPFFRAPSPYLFYCAGDAFCSSGLKGALQSALELSQEIIKLAPHLKSF